MWTDTMIDIRPFDTLGHANHGWLDARHHFSFASYHDSDRMGWGNIRVWNDDTIAAQSGFPPHPHSDMEIVTFVRSGAITHRDSLGNEGRTAAGDVQVMSAGTGITHAEYNVEDEKTPLFQIWLLPDSQAEAPGWDQREFPRDEISRRRALHLDATSSAGHDMKPETILHLRHRQPPRLRQLRAAVEGTRHSEKMQSFTEWVLGRPRVLSAHGPSVRQSGRTSMKLRPIVIDSPDHG